MMSVPVLTAVSDAVWEADLVAATEREALGVSVVRRCVDLADLLATAATGQARAAVLSADPASTGCQRSLGVRLGVK